RLGVEARHDLLLFDELLVQELDGPPPLAARALGLEHRAHAPFAQEADEAPAGVQHRADELVGRALVGHIATLPRLEGLGRRDRERSSSRGRFWLILVVPPRSERMLREAAHGSLGAALARTRSACSVPWNIVLAPAHQSLCTGTSRAVPAGFSALPLVTDAGR